MRDNVITLSAFRADLARALSKRGKRLLESPTLARDVADLEPLEAYFIVKELGLSEALPIVKLATAEQLQVCIDLDCWDGDRLSAEDLDVWLSPFAAEGRGPLAEAFCNLDEQLQVLFLAARLRVYDARQEEAPPDRPDVRRMTTEDGYLVLEPVLSDEEGGEVHPFALVEALYKRDLQEAYRLLMAAKWELPSPLEEEAHGFRSGRLADLGFPPPDEALSLFAAPDTGAVVHHVTEAATDPDARMPALYAAPPSSGSLLVRGLSALSDAATVEGLERQLVWAINAAVIAYGQSPRDMAHVTQVASRVRDTVSLGLEGALSEAAAADPIGELAAREAAAQLRQHGVRQLFRRGHAQVAAVAAAAKAALRDPVLAHWLAYDDGTGTPAPADELDRAFLHSLTARLPLLGGYEAGNPRSVRAYGTEAQLRQAEDRLADIVARHT